MAAVAYPGGSTSIVGLTQADKFIPEIWSDEIVAAYKKRLVMANLVKKMSMKGKKGDVIHIPMPTRSDPVKKAAYTAVTLQADTESEKTVTIDQHWEYSKLIEDIADKQALSSMRKFYTDDAGYALARRLDSSLIRLGRRTNGSTVTSDSANTATTGVYAEAYVGGDGTTGYTSASVNASALTDAAIRRTIQRLDDADAPMEDRYLVVPPSSRNTLMGLSRLKASYGKHAPPCFLGA
jgi:N4-gp56 family major capsid protein